MTPTEPSSNWNATDDEWLNALGEPNADGTDSDAAREGELLHLALSREQQVLEDGAEFRRLADADLCDEKLGMLLADLRRQRLLPAPRRRWRPWIWSFAAFAATSVLAWFALAPLLAPPTPLPTLIYDEPPVWRGAIGLVQRQVAAPRAEAEALLARLRSAGFDAAIYQRAQTFLVEVDVEPETRATLAEIVNPRQDLPNGGPLRIEFAPAR